MQVEPRVGPGSLGVTEDKVTQEHLRVEHQSKNV